MLYTGMQDALFEWQGHLHRAAMAATAVVGMATAATGMAGMGMVGMGMVGMAMVGTAMVGAAMAAVALDAALSHMGTLPRPTATRHRPIPVSSLLRALSATSTCTSTNTFSMHACAPPCAAAFMLHRITHETGAPATVPGALEKCWLTSH